MDLSLTDHLLAAAAAVAAGLINAVAGGGTLVTFPTLVALGLPAVSSNITNTVALCPGYFGGTYAQRDDLRTQRRRIPAMAAAASVGGLIGSTLLVISSEELFRAIVPILLLGACALLAAGDWIKAKLPARPRAGEVAVGPTPRSVTAAVFVIGIYAGYFGAGMGIIALAVLGIALDGTMVQVNALKQFVAFTANIVAAAFFAFSGKVEFSLVLVMAPASLLGGSMGGRLVRRLNPWLLRGVVIAIGIIVAVDFWFG
jgi:uncharacterized membrane protein YfcA